MQNVFKRLLPVFAAVCVALNLNFSVFALQDTQDSNASTNNASSEFTYTAFDRTDGIASNAVNCAAQTNDGYMWFGTDCGLMRYNAKEFETVSFENQALTNCRISALCCDGAGTLWVGTSDNGLFKVSGTKVVSFDTKGYLSQNIVAIECDVSNNAVVCASNGIVTINSGNNEIANLCDELTSADKSIADISCAPNGLVWCVTQNASVYFIANSQKSLVDIDGDGGKNIVSTQKPISVFATSTGRVYVGTASNEIIYFDPCDDSSFDSAVINCDFLGATYSFVEDSASRVWLCTDKGLGYIENDRAYSVDSRLSCNVNSGFCDSEANLWMCSQSEGLLEITAGRQVNLSTQAGIGSKLCNCTAVYNNLLYMGTNDGLYVYDALSVASLQENDLTALLSNVKINCIVVDENGDLLIGTNEKYGFIRYNTDTDRSWSILNSENGLCGQSVYAIACDKFGNVAVATESAVCIANDNLVKSVYEIDFNISSLEYDESGTLYAGTDSGAFKLCGQGFESLSEELDSFKVYDICAIGDSTVLVSAENGVFAYSDKNLKIALSNLQQIYSDIIYDESGIYLIGEKSVYRADYNNSANLENLCDICGLSGLCASPSISSKACMQSGVLYICTIDGTIALKTAISQNIPEIVLNNVYADGEKISSQNGTFKLKSQSTILDIDVSVLSFKGESQITYILEGFDETPRTVMSSEHIVYTNLDGGKYTLKIYGTDCDGNKTDELAIKISKQNIWYESLAFWIVLILATAIISFLVSMFFIAQKLEKEENLQIVRSNLSIASIMAVCETIDARSNVSQGHSKRVAQYSIKIANQLSCDDDFKESLYIAALLHDIGNIGVCDEVLKKPHKLTPEEIKSVQSHVDIGFSILNAHDELRDLASAVLYHHERYDGSGYSKGIKGEEIPLAARIIFAAESLDAMTTEKPYRPKLARERILNEFRVGSGTQFDPTIALAVIKIVEIGDFGTA